MPAAAPPIRSSSCTHGLLTCVLPSFHDLSPAVKDKYGEADEDDEEYSSTDYSSEDSDAEFVTPEVDAAILNIIGRIRKGDDELYQDGKDFFDGARIRSAACIG